MSTCTEHVVPESGHWRPHTDELSARQHDAPKATALKGLPGASTDTKWSAQPDVSKTIRFTTLYDFDVRPIPPNQEACEIVADTLQDVCRARGRDGWGQASQGPVSSAKPDCAKGASWHMQAGGPYAGGAPEELAAPELGRPTSEDNPRIWGGSVPPCWACKFHTSMSDNRAAPT